MDRVATSPLFYAYALTRSCLPLPGLFKTVALIPILVPSMLPGIALVYLFGNRRSSSSGASVAVIDMDDAGQTAAAAAMAMMIFYTNVGARGLHLGLARWLEHRTQAWRRR